MDYYTIEGLEELSAEISGAIDSFKHLAHSKEETFTPELLEGFKELKGCCEDFITAYTYYMEMKK